MRRLNVIVPLIVCGVLLLASMDGLAQEAPKPAASKPMNIYRVDFALHESEGERRLNTRSHAMLIVTEGPQRPNGFGRIRANTKVPVTAQDNKLVYMDVGLNIDCNLWEGRENHVFMDVSLEISNFADPGQAGSGRPLIREIRSEVQSAAQLGKPTVVAMVDDAATKRRYELEVTVTKVK